MPVTDPPGPPDERPGSIPPLRIGKRRRSAAKIAGDAGPASSPIVPSRSNRPLRRAPGRRAASAPFPSHNVESPADIDSPASVVSEAGSCVIETPTRRPFTRARTRATARPPQQRDVAASSPLTQRTASEPNSTPNQWVESPRPPLRSAHTSPEMGSRPQRPEEPKRPKSRPTLSGYQLDGNLADLIKNGPASKGGKHLEDGSIYAFRVLLHNGEHRESLVKIGGTKRHVTTRQTEIQRRCKFLQVDEHPRAVARGIPFHRFAETLVQEELANFKYSWQCECKQRHKEYFAVSDDLVIDAFERWRDFCDRRPWDKSGKIQPSWTLRLENRAKFGGGDGDFDHRDVAMLWNTFTRPQWYEIGLSNCILLWNELLQKRWTIIAIAELMIIIFNSPYLFSVCKMPFSFLILTIFGIEKIDNLGMLLPTGVAKFMEGGIQRFRVWWNGKPGDRKSSTPLAQTPVRDGGNSIRIGAWDSDYRSDASCDEHGRVDDRTPAGLDKHQGIVDESGVGGEAASEGDVSMSGDPGTEEDAEMPDDVGHGVSPSTGHFRDEGLAERASPAVRPEPEVGETSSDDD